MVEYAIETRNLRKRYGRKGIEALKGVSLRVKPGVCFGLLGPNGAGKSTLVKSLLSIVRPTSGSAALNGVEVHDPSARRGVGYLPEGHAFPRYLTGYKVCEYFGRLAGMKTEQLQREIPEKLELVGMAEWADTKITKYSKGMKQRVGLAQAMLGDPTIIFLDEPTDGLDPIGRHEVRDVIKKITGGGVTVFLNSHLLGEVETMCDEVGILHQGELLQQGPVQEITAAAGQGGKTVVIVRMRTKPLPEELWKSLGERGAKQDGEHWFKIEVDAEEAIPPLIDELRAAEVPIYEVHTVKRSLEQTFVELIAREEPPEGAAPAGAEAGAQDEAKDEGGAA